MEGRYVIKDGKLYLVLARHPDNERWILEDALTERVKIVGDSTLKKLEVVVPSAA